MDKPDQTALEAVRALGERKATPCTNPACRPVFADIPMHMCEEEPCCEGCRIADGAAQALLSLKVRHFDAAVEALEANVTATRHPSSCRTCQSGDECKVRSELVISATGLRNTVLAAIRDGGQKGLT